MKALLAVTVVASLGAGIAGSMLVSDQGGPDTDSDMVAQVTSLKAVVDDLARQNGRLVERVKLLETQPMLQPAIAAVAPPEAMELTEGITRTKVETAEDRELEAERLQGEVSLALKKIREQEDKEREAEREKRRNEALEAQLAEWAKDWYLSDYQVNEMRDTLTKSIASFGEMRTKMRGMDRDERRTAFGEIREETEKKLATFLNADQLGKYKESSNNLMFGGGGGWRGGFGGQQGGGQQGAAQQGGGNGAK